MRTNEIFQKYFKRKAIICFSLFALTMIIRVSRGHETSLSLTLIVVAFISLAVFILGFIDYNFHEKSAPKIIVELIKSEPLFSFQKIGFIIDEATKIEGYVNDYKIVFSPQVTIDGKRFLVIFIPLQIKEGLDNYFIKFNNQFHFKLTSNFIIAEASIENFNKEYSFEGIFKIIHDTTLLLIEKDIKPLEIISE